MRPVLHFGQALLQLSCGVACGPSLQRRTALRASARNLCLVLVANSCRCTHSLMVFMKSPLELIAARSCASSRSDCTHAYDGPGLSSAWPLPRAARGHPPGGWWIAGAVGARDAPPQWADVIRMISRSVVCLGCSVVSYGCSGPATASAGGGGYPPCACATPHRIPVRYNARWPTPPKGSASPSTGYRSSGTRRSFDRSIVTVS